MHSPRVLPPISIVISSAMLRTAAPSPGARSRERRTVGPETDTALRDAPSLLNTAAATQRKPIAYSSSSTPNPCARIYSEVNSLTFIHDRLGVNEGRPCLSMIFTTSSRGRREYSLPCAEIVHKDGPSGSRDCAYRLSTFSLTYIYGHPHLRSRVRRFAAYPRRSSGPRPGYQRQSPRHPSGLGLRGPASDGRRFPKWRSMDAQFASSSRSRAANTARDR